MILSSWLCLLVASCGIFRSPAPPPPDTPTGQETPKNDAPATPPKTQKPQKKDTADLWYPVQRKTSYNVAVFLPFYLSSLESDAKAIGYRSVAKEFYRGIKMAADTMEKCGNNTNIYSFDSESPFFNYYTLRDTLLALKIDL
ncbi:MAG: hypothetical protein M3Q97_04020, partial [Bacteroidota bacterium]|nr:hypothetical protein [Bacteroidota bacterium]